jgi:hypothetical protein
VFKNADTAISFLILFSLQKLPKDWIKASVLVGQFMAGENVKESVRAWKKELEISVLNKLENAQITDGSSRVGVDLVHAELGKVGLAQGFSFILSIICTDRYRQLLRIS